MSETSRTNKDANKAPDSKGGSSSFESNSGYLQPIHFLQSGWRVAIALLAPSLLGIWVDDTFDIKPVFTIIGVILGLSLVFFVLKRFVDEKYGGKK